MFSNVVKKKNEIKVCFEIQLRKKKMNKFYLLIVLLINR